MPLDEAIASIVVIVIVSGSGGRTGGNAFKERARKTRRAYVKFAESNSRFLAFLNKEHSQCGETPALVDHPAAVAICCLPEAAGDITSCTA